MRKRWVSKDAPIYVWKDDIWFNERNKKEYTVDLENQCWICEGELPVFFTKKTKFLKD